MDFKPRIQEDILGNPTCGSKETVVAVYLYDRQSECWEPVNLRNGPAPNPGFKKDLVRKPDLEGLDGFQEDIPGNPTCGSKETVVAVYLHEGQSKSWEAVNLWNGPAPNPGFKKDLVTKPDPEGLDGFQEDIPGNPTCGSKETV